MEFQLRVAEAMQNDVGKGIVRVDIKVMDALGIGSGEIVEIKGEKSTAAIAGRAYPSDMGLEIVRMDGLIRANAKTGIGDTVVVKKAVVKDGKKVIIAPAQKGMRILLKGELLKNYLLGRPVKKGDVVMPLSPAGKQRFIGSSIDDIFGGIFGNFRQAPFSLGEMKFVVVSTTPAETVRVTPATEIEFKPEAVEVVEAERIPEITYEDIGGLGEKMAKIREMVELPIMHPELFNRLGIEPPKGVLLHGPPGTGKTLIAKALANETNSYFQSLTGPEVMSKFYGESEKRIREIFDEAEKNAPSIIFIDEIDAIAPKREEVTGEVERRVVAQLLSLMDGLATRGKVVVICATNRPDALDPALRRPGRFDREIIIGVPDRNGRKEILQIHTRGMPLGEDVDLDGLADVTHGFVGADISALCKESAMSALRRVLPEIGLAGEEIPKEIIEKLFVSKEDFVSTLKYIEPSAMREVLVETPDVTWKDIGGLKDVKGKLREVVEWPLKYSESFERIGIEPVKGVLLMGPPGCGKTLLAKAVANESESNFISVKGSSMLSKWFGESEKRLAEIFKKARQASPCIILFDEIDALMPHRGTSMGEPRVVERLVNTLLTEMDGLEEMHNIVIIGATNRPDILDPALLRPGRFEEMLLIPMPDEDGRLEIFKVHTKNLAIHKEVKLPGLAKQANGYSGADIASICRKAGMNALRESLKAKSIRMKHFDKALEETSPSVPPDIMKYYESVQKGFDKRKDVPKEFVEVG